MPSETSVTPNTPMPKDYAFLPKGIAYKTLHCRKLTHESGAPLYKVVFDKRTLGLRAPKDIISQVHRQAQTSLPSRRIAVQKRDASDIAKASAELNAQFSKMPAEEKEMVLKHGFRKHSGRVGRTAQIPLKDKVFLAVFAHIRHKHTVYDALLKQGENREEARKKTKKSIENVLRTWETRRDLGKSFRDGKRAKKRKAVKQETTTKQDKATKQEKVKSRTRLKHVDGDDSEDEDYVP
ncbi:hypothetical protein GQ44DRAFT_698039 [Phaeosphaeriaceae sp. PMI808]|nr:hypothetical protein GQ44DRAFT_698039 [Phaeosphaeriaceae sp. PMI808]